MRVKFWPVAGAPDLSKASYDPVWPRSLPRGGDSAPSAICCAPQRIRLHLHRHHGDAVVAVHWIGAADFCRSCAARQAGLTLWVQEFRIGLNEARISLVNSSGSSQAAKWPPLPTSLKYATPG